MFIANVHRGDGRPFKDRNHISLLKELAASVHLGSINISLLAELSRG